MSKPSRSNVSIGDNVGPIRCPDCNHRLADFYIQTVKIKCQCGRETEIIVTQTDRGTFTMPEGVKYEIIKKKY